MPIKGLVLILLAVIIFAYFERENIYSRLQSKDKTDEETECTED